MVILCLGIETKLLFQNYCIYELKTLIVCVSILIRPYNYLFEIKLSTLSICICMPKLILVIRTVAPSAK